MSHVLIGIDEKIAVAKQTPMNKHDVLDALKRVRKATMAFHASVRDRGAKMSEDQILDMLAFLNEGLDKNEFTVDEVLVYWDKAKPFVEMLEDIWAGNDDRLQALSVIVAGVKDKMLKLSQS